MYPSTRGSKGLKEGRLGGVVFLRPLALRRAGACKGRGRKAGVLYISMAKREKTCPQGQRYLNGMLNLQRGQKSVKNPLIFS